MSKVSAPRKPRQPKKKAPAISLALAIDHQVYQVEPIPAGEFGTKAFRLAKKSADGAVYDVIRTHDGIVQCDCPSYEATHLGTYSTCKHGTALVVLGLLDAPSWSAPAAPLGRVRDEFDEATEKAPCIACAAPADEAEPFTVPAAYDAAAWSDAILGELRTVAPAEAVAYAEAIRAESWQFEGMSIRPMFASLDELRAMLPAESFAEDLLAAIGEPPVASPDEEAAAVEEERIGWDRPARRSFLVAPSPKPVRPAPLPDGRYSLVELVTGQAAILRGEGGPVFGLMAKALDDLAASIRHTGASNVADYEDRIAEMERSYRDARDMDRLSAGYAAC